MRARVVDSWIVPIEGHQFDLEDFPLWLHGSRFQVSKRDDRYYLVLPASLVGLDSKQIRTFAGERVAELNGVGFMLSGSYRPVSLGEGLHGVDADGKVCSTVLEVGCAELRMKGGHVRISVGGVADADTRIGAAVPILRAAEFSPSARDSLAIIGRANPTWSELYLVFELVESDSGKRMFVQGWVEKSAATLFTRTANSYSALGRLARHGKAQTVPPAQPMTLPEATALVRSLTTAWLRDMARREPGMPALKKLPPSS